MLRVVREAVREGGAALNYARVEGLLRDGAGRVRGVFDSVASRYDLMNDVLSMGLHRAWKAYTVQVANLKPGERVLDIAGGTGDLSAVQEVRQMYGMQVITISCLDDLLAYLQFFSQ